MVYLALLLSLVLVLTTTWALGGFRTRTDRLIDTAPGTLITTGPYQFTFTEATAQRKRRFDGPIYWQLTVRGTARNTGTESLAPKAVGPDAMFVSKDEVSGEIQEPQGAAIGPEATSANRESLVPGLPATEYRVEFDYSERYVPTATLRFLAFQLTFRDATLLGTGEKTWDDEDQAYHFTLPVRVLPDAVE